MSQVITPRGFQQNMLIYVISSVLLYFCILYAIIESLEFPEGREESCFYSVNIRRICIKSCETFC